MNGLDAVFEWAEIDVMVANMLFTKLSHGSEYCGKATEMCKGGMHVDDSTDNNSGNGNGNSGSGSGTLTVGKPVLDIMVVVDGSQNLNNEDWHALKLWLVDFIDSFNTPEISAKYDRTSMMVVVQFSSEGENYDYAPGGYTMNFSQLDELDALERDLQNMIQMRRGSDAYSALEFVLEKVVPAIDSAREEENAGVIQEHNRILAMIVNSEPTDADFFNQDSRTMTNSEIIGALDQTFSERFVIGVGSGLSTYNSAYEEINHNSFNLPIYHLDGYISSADVEAALTAGFMEAVVEEMTKCALMYEVGQEMVHYGQSMMSSVY